jgi:hypothetical protein
MSLPTKAGPILTSLLDSLGTTKVDASPSLFEQLVRDGPQTAPALTSDPKKSNEYVNASETEITRNRNQEFNIAKMRMTQSYGTIDLHAQAVRGMSMREIRDFQEFVEMQMRREIERLYRNPPVMYRYDLESPRKAMDTAKKEGISASSAPSSSERKSPSFTAPSSLSGDSLLTSFLSKNSNGSSGSNLPKLISGPKKPSSSR